MGKQFHFVVLFDTETQEFSVDYDVELNGNNGSIYDEETETWSKPSDDGLDEKQDDAIYADLMARLTLDKKIVYPGLKGLPLIK